MKFDREDIRLSEIGADFYYSGKNVTCKYHYSVNWPVQFTMELGWPPSGSVVATAFCHDDDEYDVELGQKIALAKAEARAYRLVSNEIKRRFAELEDFLASANVLAEKFYDKAENSERHNEEYIKRVAN